MKEFPFIEQNKKKKHIPTKNAYSINFFIIIFF